MLKDRFGQAITAASALAVARNDEAIDRLFALQPGSAGLADAALAADPDFALAHCTKARSLLQSGDVKGARTWALRGRDLASGLSQRERAHADIVCRAIHGESATALRLLREHAAAHPRDAVPLSFALGVYGLLGFGGLADFEAQQVALLQSVAFAWGEGEEAYWFLAAFGWALVEVGEVERGVAMLERTLAINPDNANAVHGRAHGYYERGAPAEGEAFIADWLPRYSRDAILHGHLAWHQALFALQQGDAERALAIYDDAVGPEASRALPMFTMIDSASFLFRTMLHGSCDAVRHPRYSRGDRLAEYAAAHFTKPGVPFVNVHLALVYALMEDAAALDAHIEAIAALVADGRQPCGPIVLKVCAALADYAAGRYSAAASALEEALPATAKLGGSRAQRDVLVDAAVVALLQNGDFPLAQGLAHLRAKERAGHLDERWLRRIGAALQTATPKAAC